MKHYDFNVTASQIIRVDAETEKEAVEIAFYEAFGGSQRAFASTEYELVNVKEEEEDERQ